MVNIFEASRRIRQRLYEVMKVVSHLKTMARSGLDHKVTSLISRAPIKQQILCSSLQNIHQASGEGREGKKSHHEKCGEKKQGFCLLSQGHVLKHMKYVPWHVGMAADQRPFSRHVALAEPFSNCPSGQWKVQVDP